LALDHAAEHERIVQVVALQAELASTKAKLAVSEAEVASLRHERDLLRRERERELPAASDQTLQAAIGTGSSGGTVSLAVDQSVEVRKTQPDVAKKRGKTPRKPPRRSAGAGAAARPEPEPSQPEPSQPEPSQLEAKQSPPVLDQSVEVRSAGHSAAQHLPAPAPEAAPEAASDE
jgi:hypothetical protein